MEQIFGPWCDVSVLQVLDLICFVCVTAGPVPSYPEAGWAQFVTIVSFIVTLLLLVMYLLHVIEMLHFIPWLIVVRLCILLLPSSSISLSL